MVRKGGINLIKNPLTTNQLHASFRSKYTRSIPSDLLKPLRKTHPPGRGNCYHCRSSSSPDTLEANLKKVGLWKQGRDYCRLTAVGCGWVHQRAASTTVFLFLSDVFDLATPMLFSSNTQKGLRICELGSSLEQ